MTHFFGSDYLLFYFLAYALGSLPSFFLVSRKFYRDNLQKKKGHHTAAKAWREHSKKLGFVIFIIDALKGIIPCALAFSFEFPPEIIAAIGFFAVLAHCYSPWLNFGGGKGAPTAFGAFLFVYWPASILGMVTFLIITLIGKSAGLAGIIASLAAFGAIIFSLDNSSLWVVMALIEIVILLRHREYLRVPYKND